MQVSYNTQKRYSKIKQACLKVNMEGRFVLNAAALLLLELEDTATDGVIFGYQNGNCYIAYSASPNAFKGNFKKGESAFRFNSKAESLKLLQHFKTDKANLLIDASNIVVAEAHKFYLLTILTNGAICSANITTNDDTKNNSNNFKIFLAWEI